MKSAVDTSAKARRGVLLPGVAGCLYLINRSPAPDAPAFDVKDVLVEEAKLMIAAGALVLDVRERAAGFAGAVNLKPGIQGWASAGLPIEHGPGKTA